MKYHRILSYCDGRNEYTVNTCKEILKQFPDLSYRAPLI